MDKIRICIFDDAKVVRDFLQELLLDDAEFQLVGSFPNALQLKSNIETCRPDVVVMDISMPSISGIEATRWLRVNFPHLPILMQTVFDDDESVFAAIEAGANGYVLKDASNEQLRQAIKDVYDGGSSLSPSIAKKVLNHLQQTKFEKTEFKLSPKELEVLHGLTQGLALKQIGAKMDISYDTVRSHIKKIYEKLHVGSMTEAVLMALKHKLV
jgi:DNA-binding NarL/FixJ family response regulator